MAWKGKVLSVFIPIAVAISGWCWSLYQDHEIRLTAQEKRVAILTEVKADKSYVHRMEVQLERQTVILENQQNLLEKQYFLMQDIASSKLTGSK